MSDAERLLELIENGVVEHGGELGGWTARTDDTLQLFDGRVTLSADVPVPDLSRPTVMAHVHVFARLNEHDDEVLDACLVGIGDDFDSSLKQAAFVWLTAVAGPIKSFLDNKPICMTCQAGVQGGDTSEGYSESDYGLSGMYAFVGPAIVRGLEGSKHKKAIDETMPWFKFAAESAAPRRVHLAKSTVLSQGKEGWIRELEVDGHDVSYHDPDWPAAVQGPEYGYATRFAVFAFPINSTEIARRAELERTIRHFATNYSRQEDINVLENLMFEQGFDPQLVHDVETISTLAFGRMLFESHGVDFPTTVIRARKDGRIETDVPLMSLPAFTRAKAIGSQLHETISSEELQSLCLYSAESSVILKSMESQGDDFDFKNVTLHPSVVPDLGVDDKTMDAALAMLNKIVEKKIVVNDKKPWWKFW